LIKGVENSIIETAVHECSEAMTNPEVQGAGIKAALNSIKGD